MKVLIFGATGMIGQGVLREALLATDVEQVRTVGRTATGLAHPKLSEVLMRDLFDYDAVEARLQGFDACFFCLGVSSSGMDEAAYTRLTYDLTLAAAETLARLNPRMVFVYVSGAGADGTEKGPTMWARVRGRLENTLRGMPFKAAYVLRPGMILPMHGARSKTALYRRIYAVISPLVKLGRRLFPHQVTSTEAIGQVMLALVRGGATKSVLEMGDIEAVYRRSGHLA